MRHKLATWFLWLAYKLEPAWIEGILRVKAEGTNTPSPEQTPEPLPPTQYIPTNEGVDMIDEDRHFPPPFDRSPDKAD